MLVIVRMSDVGGFGQGRLNLGSEFCNRNEPFSVLLWAQS